MGAPDILKIIKEVFEEAGDPFPDICGYTVEYGDPELAGPEWPTLSQMMTRQLRATGLLPETQYISGLLRRETTEEQACRSASE